MPKADTDDQKPLPPDSLTEGWRSLAEIQAQGLKALTGLNSAWHDTLSDMGNEVMRFVADRIKEDVKTQQRMLHCKDAAELQKIQAEFLQKAIDQYGAETGKLVDLNQKLFEAAVTPQKSDG